VKLEAAQLDEARLAIDGIAALLPALEGHTDTQTLRDFNQLLANVRLSYASATDISRVQDAGPVPKRVDAAPQADADAGAPTGDTAVPGVSAVQDEGHAPNGEGGAPTDTPSGPME
jgi:hypothetical protein